MKPVFLENLYTLLLLVHLLFTFVLVGSMSHNLVCVLGYARGQFGRQNVEKRYAWTFLWSYTVVYVIGALIYPAFRIYLRHHYFDAAMPWATGLFEVKEHWGALALAMLAFYYALRRTFSPSEERDKLWLYVPLGVLLNVIVWYKILIGCFLTILKGHWA